MEARKNIFGQYKDYESPVLPEGIEPTLLAILNGIADDIQSKLTDAEFVKETRNASVILQHIVGIVNEYLPEGVLVDGTTLKPFMKIVLQERLDIIAANHPEPDLEV